MRRRLLALALGCAVCLTGAAAWAQSPLVAELEVVATRYHENPARLDAVREGLEQAAGVSPQVDTLVALARVCFIWGDIGAETAEHELQAVLEEKAPTNPADWTLKDVREA